MLTKRKIRSTQAAVSHAFRHAWLRNSTEFFSLVQGVDGSLACLGDNLFGPGPEQLFRAPVMGEAWYTVTGRVLDNNDNLVPAFAVFHHSTLERIVERFGEKPRPRAARPEPFECPVERAWLNSI